MKVVFIGMGSIGRKHCDALLTIHPDADIYALRSDRNAGTETGFKNIFSWDDIPVPDFIIIATPTYLHRNDILKALRFGCPLMIEKPVVSDWRGQEDIEVALAERSIISYVACNMRFHPALRYTKNLLSMKQLRINEVNIYSGSYLPEWRPGKDFRSYYSVDPTKGGGVHLDLVHELDYCVWLFGYPESCISSKKNSSSLNIQAVDSAYFLLDYPEFSATITLNYFRRDAKRTIEILTDEDTISIDLLRNTVATTKSKEVLFAGDFKMTDTYVEQLKYFISLVEKNEKSMNDFATGIKILQLAMSNETSK